mgnify:CR=1 FL=1
MADKLMQQGTDLMLFGMGSVLVFLTMLVIAMVAMSALVRRWFAEPEPVPTKNRAPGAGQNARPASRVSDKKLAIIKAAIEQHRARRR